MATLGSGNGLLLHQRADHDQHLLTDCRIDSSASLMRNTCSCRRGLRAAYMKVSRVHNNRLAAAAPSRRRPLVRASVYEDTLPTSQQPGSNTINNSYFQGATTSKPLVQRVEELIEQAIFNCRFLTLLGVVGSLAGSVLCFLKGCWFVLESFTEYFHTCWHGVSAGKVILLLVEAVDVYLMGTVMLIFGMGLYELFVSSLDVPGNNCFTTSRRTTVCGSNLFGLFRLKERPKWLEIHSLDELKTKLGHVIVMILLVGMFEKSKKVPVHSGTELLCFSASILLSSGSLYLLSKLHHSTK